MGADAQWRVRGIRGATTVEANTRDAVLAATQELLAEMIQRNDLRTEDIASAVFTTSRDIDAEFPAAAARDGFGWTNVALLCGHEMGVPGALSGCLRILIHCNSLKPQSEIQHVYLRGAIVLRPDMADST